MVGPHRTSASVGALSEICCSHLIGRSFRNETTKIIELRFYVFADVFQDHLKLRLIFGGIARRSCSNGSST